MIKFENENLKLKIKDAKKRISKWKNKEKKKTDANTIIAKYRDSKNNTGGAKEQNGISNFCLNKFLIKVFGIKMQNLRLKMWYTTEHYIEISYDIMECFFNNPETFK